MKKIVYITLLLAGALIRADSLNGCLEKDQIRALRKQAVSLETQLKEALQREITAQIEKEGAEIEKETARQLYFKLRKARTELERSSNAILCPKER